MPCNGLIFIYVVIGSDCLEAINLLKQGDMDRSRHTFIVREIIQLMEQRNSCITHIRRTQNYVSHAMASYGRTSGRTTVWLGSGPDKVVQLCKTDCSVST